MPLKARWQELATSWRISAIALSWLALVSLLHFWLNTEHGDRKTITMGYMPVITNLASPLLDYASKDNDGTRFKALKFASFAEMAESLRNGEIDAAFMIAPLAVVLRQQGEDVKIVYIGNRHESTFVTRKDLNVNNPRDLIGKTVAVPMRYSGHNLSLLQLLEEQGLTDSVKVVEMNPPDMAAALSAGSLDAYYVGEPFAAQTLKSGHAKLFSYVEDLWPKFICNLVVVRQDLIEKDPEAVETLVQGAARSGLWAQKNTQQAAEIASQYWNQPVDLVKYALTTPNERILYNDFMPKQQEIQYLADMMQRFDLISGNDITGLVEDGFAQNVDLSDITDLESIIP